MIFSLYDKIIAFGLIFPILLFFSLTIFYDSSKQEPLRKILLGMIFGTITLVLTMIFYKIIMFISSYSSVDYIKVIINIISIIVIGIIIEIVRFSLFYFLTNKNKDFDELYDGIVYSLSMMFTYVVLVLTLYIFIIKDNSINFISVITIIPTQIFTSIIMGYYMSIAIFTKKDEQKEKDLIKALLFPIVINNCMYILLVNQNIIYAYSTILYYIVVVISLIVQIISAIIATAFLLRINKLDNMFKHQKKYPKKYNHLMTKKEYEALDKRNRNILKIRVKKNVYPLITKVMVILLIVFISLVIVSNQVFDKELRNPTLNLGKDVIYKIEGIVEKTNLISYERGIENGAIIIKTKYKSINKPENDIDRYMTALLLNGYQYTSDIKKYSQTKIYKMTIKSNSKNKIIIISMKVINNGYEIEIEKRDGTISK